MPKPPSIESMVEEALPRMHQGDCPCCGRPGPTELHDAYWCRSVILATASGRSPLVGCRRCGMAHHGRMLLETVLCGWWGKRGLFLTPVQLGRTLYALVLPPHAVAPSRKLQEHVRALMAAERRERFLPRCPACNEPYDPEDYREDAPAIFCTRCKGELPRAA